MNLRKPPYNSPYSSPYPNPYITKTDPSRDGQDRVVMWVCIIAAILCAALVFFGVIV